MRLGVLPGRVASAAVFAFFLGTAAAGAAIPRDLALAGVANELFYEFFAYPAVADPQKEKPSFSTEEFMRRAGALFVGLRDAGVPAERVAAEALAGRALALNGDRERGRRHLDAALAESGRLGWSDARASGILRDLAWLAAEAGDIATSAAYTARADVCAVPCADDALAALGDIAKAANVAIEDEYHDKAWRKVADFSDANAIVFLEAEYGPRSAELADAWISRGYGSQDDRPWQALDYLQRGIDVRTAAGLPATMSLETRRGIARLLLEAGEYARLDPYAEKLTADALAAVATAPDNHIWVGVALDAARLRARGLWQLKDDRARAAYGTAIDVMFRFGDEDAARLLLQDLLDARYEDEAARVADAIVRAFPGDSDALLALGRISARAGRYADAAAWLAEIADPSEIARLQRAVYLERAGQRAEAAALRASISLPPVAELSWGGLGDLTDPRDYGAYEGAAEVARTYLPLAEGMITGGTYTDAQRLWQIAYTLALGGEVVNSFRLMKEAASIAARLSFAEANDTDGGSLQLLRRDKFRYLLFVDIAWAASTGAPPDSMSVSSRY